MIFTTGLIILLFLFFNTYLRSGVCGSNRTMFVFVSCIEIMAFKLFEGNGLFFGVISSLQ